MKILLCLILSLSSVSCWAQVSCSEIFEKTHPFLDYYLMRVGYLPLEGRTVGWNIKDNLWTVSLLRQLEDGKGFAWEQRISLNDQVRYFEFPMPREMMRQAQQRETTENLTKDSIEFVYEQYRNEFENREVFDREFVRKLREEDQARIEDNLTVWTVRDLSGDIVASWGLYRHEVGEFAGKIELIRLASSNTRLFSIRNLLPFVSEYLNVHSLETGSIVLRSDRAGARLYKRFGAREVDVYDGGRKVVLEITVEAFLEKFPTIEVENGNRPLQFVRMLDENFIH